MHASNFAVQFDPVRAELIKISEEELLRSRKEEVPINAEIDELNIYGDPQRFLGFDFFQLTSTFALSRQGLVLQGT